MGSAAYRATVCGTRRCSPPAAAPGPIGWWPARISARRIFTRVLPLANVGVGSGSVLLGLNSPALPVPSNPNSPNSNSNLRQNIIPELFRSDPHRHRRHRYRGRPRCPDPQSARHDLHRRNAGGRRWRISTLPNLADAAAQQQTRPGPGRRFIRAQYSLAGGNVTITAQHDIAHELENDSPAVTDCRLVEGTAG